MIDIELRRTGQGGAYGEWMQADEGPAAAFDAAENEAIETDEDSGEIEVGGRSYVWRKRSAQ